MPVSHPTILRIAIFLLTFAAFARLIPCDFTWWDDQQTISENPMLNPPTWNSVKYYWTHENMELYVPVTYTVWNGLAVLAHRDAPDANGLMLNAWVFHLANVLIHATTAAIVFQLLLRLIGNDWAAALGAMLFALHPVQVESVGWISGTKDLLCGLFSVSALLMYVRSTQLKSDDPHKRGPARRRYFLGILFFILAILSKPTAVVVPLMAGVISVFLLDRPVRRSITSLIPWLLLMIPCLYWTQKVQPAQWSSPLPIWTRPVVAADAIAFYLCKLVWPMHLCIDYGHTPSAIVATHLIYFTWILPTAIAAFLRWRHKQHRTAIAAVLLFILPLLPILGLVPFDFQFISTTADHYLYLPMVGAGLLFAWVFDRFRFPRWIAVITLLLLGIRTVFQEPYWQDTRALFRHTLDVNRTSLSAMDGLGFITGRDARILSKAGQKTEARALFGDSIDWYNSALLYDPKSVPSMTNLALDYQAIGRTDLGLEQIHRIVQLQPELPEGLKADPLILAHKLIDFGDIPGAIAVLDDALRQNPLNAGAAILREQATAHLPKR